MLERLEDCEVDDYTDITTLIGVEFDDNTVLGPTDHPRAESAHRPRPEALRRRQGRREAFLQYNDNSVERGLFYQALNVVLEVVLDDELEIADYEANFRRMFGDARMDAALGSVDGSVRFFGLTPTSSEAGRARPAPAADRQLQEAYAARARMQPVVDGEAASCRGWRSQASAHGDPQAQ